jgi:hypothetical protein
MQTFKSVLGNIIDEVAKKFGYNKEQLGQIVDRGVSEANTGADVGTVLQETLSKLIKPQIVTGLDVTATLPPSLSVLVSPGYGSAQGLACELKTQQNITIDNNLGLYYIVLNGSRVTVSASLGLGLPIAKVVIPYPRVTNKILNDKNPESEYDGYIISGKDLLFDNNFIIDDESIAQLKNTMSKIFAEYIFGTIKLNESLQISNEQGTLRADSDSVNFYDINGDELASYGAYEARVGNIKVTPSTIQSRDFQQGAHGFRMKDNGDAEFDDITARGTIHASAGTIDGDLTVGGSLSSPNFTSGYSGNGWKIDGDGTATFNNGLFRGELHTSVFVKDEIHATNGTLVVTNATVIASGLMSGDSSVYVKDAVFATNDIVRMKTSDSTSEYMRITGGTNPYTLARDLDGTGANDFQAGDAIVSQQSRVELVATGDTAANLPYIDVVKRNSTTWNDTSTKARLGNLAGITDANFGTLSDYGLYTNNGYFTGLLKASNFSAGTISGTNIAGTNIYGGYINGTNMTGGTISGTTITGINLNGQTITGVTLTASTITGSTITGGTISGTTITGLNLNGQTINGVILTSPTIKTSASGARVELDYSGLTVYDASENIVLDAIISGTTSGDVIVGNYAADRGLFYDNSANSFTLNAYSGTTSCGLKINSAVPNTITLYGGAGIEFNDISTMHSARIGFDDDDDHQFKLTLNNQASLYLMAGSGNGEVHIGDGHYINLESDTVVTDGNSLTIEDGIFTCNNLGHGDITYGAVFRNYYHDPVGGTGAAVHVTVEGNNISNGIYVVTKSATAIQYGLQLDHNSSGGAGFCLHNIVDGTGFQLINWGDAGLGMSIQNCRPDRVSPYPHKGLNIWNLISTGGYGIQITNNYSGTGGTGLEVWNGDHGAGETVGIYVNNNSANYGMKIDHWNGDAGLYVDSTYATSAILASCTSGTAINGMAMNTTVCALAGHGTGGYADMGLFVYGDGRSIHYANSDSSIITLGQWGAGPDIQGTGSTWYILSNGAAHFYSHEDSDKRIKKDIYPIYSGLETICSLNPVSFHFTEEYLKLYPAKKDIERTGFIAQEFQNVYPNNVGTSKDNYLTVEQTAIIPHLVASVKELKERIDTLEQQVKILMAEKPKWLK